MVPETGVTTLHAAPGWRSVDLVSDLHLHSSEPATAQLLCDYLQAAPFDALFILGDLFEVWVGDDMLAPAAATQDPEAQFVQAMCAQLRACALRKPVYVMHGNRDFLLGTGFTQHSGTVLLNDPTVLDWNGQRWLLSHGDAWCLDDHEYMHFRAQVRSHAWQAQFLAQPLADRCQAARRMREHSEARKKLSQTTGSPITYADVDTATAVDWLQRSGAQTLIHGHTHRPAEHLLGPGQRRLVLSDWDAHALPPRAEALRLQADGHWCRVPPLCGAPHKPPLTAQQHL